MTDLVFKSSRRLERRSKAEPGTCPTCDREREHEKETGHAPFHPPHDPSPNCKSGGHSHCSCGTCF